MVIPSQPQSWIPKVNSHSQDSKKHETIHLVNGCPKNSTAQHRAVWIMSWKKILRQPQHLLIIIHTLWPYIFPNHIQVCHMLPTRIIWFNKLHTLWFRIVVKVIVSFVVTKFKSQNCIFISKPYYILVLASPNLTCAVIIYYFWLIIN